MVTIGKNVGVLVCQILTVQTLLRVALMGVEIRVFYIRSYRISHKDLKSQVLQYHVQNFINLMIATTPLMNAKMLENLAVIVLIILCAVLMVVPIFVFTDMLTMVIVIPVTIYHLTQGILSPAPSIYLTRRFTEP